MKVAIVLFIIGICVSSTINREIKVAVLNDIHYDPFYDDEANISESCRTNSPLAMPTSFLNPDASPLGHFGCDSPPALVELMLEKVKDLEPDLDILLVSGDFLAHDFAVKQGSPPHFELIKEYIEKVFMTLSGIFPNTVILPAIGNNDIKYHYRAPTQNDDAGEYYAFLSNVLLNKVAGNKYLDKDTINKTFLKYGYYRMDFSSELSILSINSLYFNTKVPSTEPTIRSGQLDWIESQLNSAEPNRKFILFCHIYPGVYEAFGHQIFWDDNDTERFVSMLENYSQHVSMLLGAHTHFGDVRIHQKIQDSKESTQDYLKDLLNFIGVETAGYDTTRSDSKFAMLVTPSVTPTFLNNPGVTLFRVNGNTPSNVRFVFLQLYRFPKTKEEALYTTVDFKEELGIDTFTPSEVQEFLDRVESSSYLFYYKLLPFKIGYFGMLKSLSWAVFDQLGAISIWSTKKYMCMTRHMTTAEYDKCVG